MEQLLQVERKRRWRDMDRGADLANRDTRRQLLEYAYVFGLDGVLLVDMAAGAIREVEFPGLARD